MRIRIETRPQDNQATQLFLDLCRKSRTRAFHEVTILVDGEEVHKKAIDRVVHEARVCGSAHAVARQATLAEPVC